MKQTPNICQWYNHILYGYKNLYSHIIRLYTWSLQACLVVFAQAQDVHPRLGCALHTTCMQSRQAKHQVRISLFLLFYLENEGAWSITICLNPQHCSKLKVCSESLKVGKHLTFWQCRPAPVYFVWQVCHLQILQESVQKYLFWWAISVNSTYSCS